MSPLFSRMLSISVCLYFSLRSLFLSASAFTSIFVSVSVCMSVCLTVCLFSCLSVAVSLSHSLFLYNYIATCRDFVLSCLSQSVSLYLFHCISLYLQSHSIILSIYSVSVQLVPSVSIVRQLVFDGLYRY